MDPEIIDISALNFEDEKSSNGTRLTSLKSSNFGGGIELLMNDRVKESVGKHTSDLTKVQV